MSDTAGHTEVELVEAAFGLESQESRNARAIFESACDLGERSLANIVIAIAFTEPALSPYSRAMLKSLYQALTEDPAGDWRLVLKQRRRGRKMSVLEREELENEDSTIAFWVNLLADKEGKREAAIARCSELFGKSRATIFSALRRVRNRPPSSK